MVSVNIYTYTRTPRRTDSVFWRISIRQHASLKSRCANQSVFPLVLQLAGAIAQIGGCRPDGNPVEPLDVINRPSRC